MAGTSLSAVGERSSSNGLRPWSWTLQATMASGLAGRTISGSAAHRSGSSFPSSLFFNEAHNAEALALLVVEGRPLNAHMETDDLAPASNNPVAFVNLDNPDRPRVQLRATPAPFKRLGIGKV